MKYYIEESLCQFDFWGGAQDTVQYLTEDEIETIEEYLEDMHGDEMISQTDINDFFRDEDDTIAALLGYNNFSEIIDRNDSEDNDSEYNEE